MRSLINLETTVFDLSTFVTSDAEKQFVTGVSQEGKLVRLPEFAMIVPGWERVADQETKDFVLNSLFMVEEFRAPVFFCPWEWRWSKVLSALKVFPSTGEAKRNGWDKEIDWGLGEAVVRVKKHRGIITVWKPKQEHFEPGYWARTEAEFAKDDD